jgi:hypothetical protein
LIGRDACRLGGCHTNDHLACSRSGCESGRDVDGIAECREFLDGGAEPGRANECLAGVDGRSYWMATPGLVLARAAYSDRSIAAATAAAAWRGPVITTHQFFVIL